MLLDDDNAGASGHGREAAGETGAPAPAVGEAPGTRANGGAVDVSVIIPCYNCANELGEQLQALTRQVWQPGWEVLIADNGSTDGLKEQVARFEGCLPGLRIADASARKGPAHARNAGVRAAKGDKLLFPDADDVVAPGWLAAMAQALDEHELVACRLEYERLNGRATIRSRGHGQSSGLRQYRDPPYLPHASGTSLGVRRTTHERATGFDEDLPNLQDTDYCWRLQLMGVPLVFVPDAIIHYRFREDPRAVVRQARNYGRYNVLLYKMYRDRGMPRASVGSALRRWYKLVRSLPAFAVRGDYRLRWIRNLAWCYGRLEGCIVYRVFAP